MIKIDPLSLADTRFALHLHALIFLGIVKAQEMYVGDLCSAFTGDKLLD